MFVLVWFVLSPVVGVVTVCCCSLCVLSGVCVFCLCLFLYVDCCVSLLCIVVVRWRLALFVC